MRVARMGVSQTLRPSIWGLPGGHSLALGRTRRPTDRTDGTDQSDAVHGRTAIRESTSRPLSPERGRRAPAGQRAWPAGMTVPGRACFRPPDSARLGHSKVRPCRAGRHRSAAADPTTLPKMGLRHLIVVLQRFLRPQTSPDQEHPQTHSQQTDRNEYRPNPLRHAASPLTSSGPFHKGPTTKVERTTDNEPREIERPLRRLLAPPDPHPGTTATCRDRWSGNSNHCESRTGRRAPAGVTSVTLVRKPRSTRWLVGTGLGQHP